MILEKTTKREQKMASDIVMSFTSAISGRKSDSVDLRIQDSEELYTLPRKALEFLVQILTLMSAGKAISLMPSESELSTQQAADMLQVSRPHIVKLLEEGVIPFKKAGSHRRILLEDLMTYAAAQDKIRSKNLKLLTKQAQDLNLGYE